VVTSHGADARHALCKSKAHIARRASLHSTIDVTEERRPAPRGAAYDNADYVPVHDP